MSCGHGIVDKSNRHSINTDFKMKTDILLLLLQHLAKLMETNDKWLIVTQVTIFGCYSLLEVSWG